MFDWRLDNVAALVAATVVSYVTGFLAINAVGPLYGFTELQAPLLLTLLATNAAIGLLVLLTQRRAQNSGRDDAVAHGQAVFVFTTAAGALVTSVSNFFETWETRQVQNNAIELLIGALVDESDARLVIYLAFSMLIAVIAFFLVRRGAALALNPDAQTSRDLPAFSNSLLTISLIVDSVWKPVPYDSEAIVFAWSIILLLIGLVVLSVFAFLWAKITCQALFAATSLLLNGIVEAGKSVRPKTLIRLLALLVRRVSRGLARAAVFCGGAIFVLFATGLVLDDLSNGTIPFVDQGLALLLRATLALSGHLLPVAIGIVGFVLVTQLGARVWSARRLVLSGLAAGTHRVATAASTAFMFVARGITLTATAFVNFLINCKRRLASAKLADFKSFDWSRLPRLLRWPLSRPSPLEFALGLTCIFLLAQSSLPGSFGIARRAAYAGSVAERPAPIQWTDLLLQLDEEPVQIQLPEFQIRLDGIRAARLQVCDLGPTNLDWVNASTTMLEVPASRCRIPTDAMIGRTGAVLLFAVASLGENQSREEQRSIARAKTLAATFQAQLSADIPVFVLDLGMAKSFNSFSSLSRIFPGTMGHRPAAAVFLEAIPDGAQITREDAFEFVAGQANLRHVSSEFTRCQIYALSDEKPDELGSAHSCSR